MGQNTGPTTVCAYVTRRVRQNQPLADFALNGMTAINAQSTRRQYEPPAANVPKQAIVTNSTLIQVEVDWSLPVNGCPALAAYRLALFRYGRD